MLNFLLSGRLWLILLFTLPALALAVSSGNQYSWFLDSVSHFRHYFLLFGILSAVPLFFLSKRAFLMCLLMAAYPVYDMARGIGFELSSPSIASHTNKILLLQQNMHYASLDHQSFLDLVDKEKPDVITLQEVSSKNLPLLEKLKPGYSRQQFCEYSRVGGVAVLLKNSFQTGPIETGCLQGDGLTWITMPTHKTTIASLHLHWPYPFDQPAQTQRMAKTLQNLPGKTIIAGDFNATPWSRTVSMMANASATKIIGGYRNTLHSKKVRGFALLRLPIDHILVSKGSNAKARTGPFVGSDHLPLLADISLRSGD